MLVSLRYFVAVLLAIATVLAHAAPSGVLCIGEAEAHADEAAPDDCCDDEEGAPSEECGDGCSGCFCCPLRTAVASPALAHSAQPKVHEPVLEGARADVEAGEPGDIFQPPRA